MTPSDPDLADLAALAARRVRVGLALTALVVAAYFGFMLLVAFAPVRMGAQVAPGLSWGILLTGLYARWANGGHDAEVARLRRDGGA